jgi:16S rRNA (cytosine1402-N4)-methyltransferase
MDTTFSSSVFELELMSMRPFHKEESISHGPEGIHFPVMLKEVLHFLQPKSGGFYVDATLGLGGHAEAILRASAPEGRLLGIDQDIDALSLAVSRLTPFQGRYHLVHSNFSALKEIVIQKQFGPLDGILFDLGLSSLQLESSDRGFSFQKEGPLDMRMDRELAITAAEVVNYYPEKDLANILYQFGEEPFSRRIARAVVRARPLRNTKELAEVVSRALRFRPHQRIHPATRTFQALRIFVNDELGRLPQVIRTAVDLLAPGGRIVFLSFHSLEDRIVKDSFRALSHECNCPPEVGTCTCGKKKLLKRLTKQPIQPTAEELAQNPRSRSAKLRVAERLRPEDD